MFKDVSIDEFLSKRKDFVKSNGVVMKAASQPSTWNDADRSARFVISTEEPDRDNDIIVQAGMNTDSFLKNPIAPFSHRTRDFPIGEWKDIEKILNGRPKRTEATLKFIPEGGDPDADRAAFHVKHGTIKCCSVGFIPKRIQQRERDADDGWPGYMIHESELLESSVVPLPANPSAMVKELQSDQEFRIAREFIEDILDNWEKHPESGLIVPRSKLESALKEINGNRTSLTIKVDASETEEVIQKAIEENKVNLTEAAEKSLLSKFTDSFKSIFVKAQPSHPALASPEAKAERLARIKAYRERIST